MKGRILDKADPMVWPPNKPMVKAKTKYTQLRQGARCLLLRMNRPAPINAPIASASGKCTTPMVMMMLLKRTDSCDVCMLIPQIDGWHDGGSLAGGLV